MDKEKIMLLKFGSFLFLLLIFSAVLLLFIKPVLKTPPGTFELEVVKAILQVGVISVLGGVVSLLSFHYQKEREQIDKRHEDERKKAEYREDRLKDILAKVVANYSSVKTARRFLRARAIQSNSEGQSVLGRVYDTYMDVLSEAQLEIEHLMDDVMQTYKPAFTSHQEVGKALRSMKKYLDDLTSEYEKFGGGSLWETPSKNLADPNLSHLADFLARGKKSNFPAQFTKSYHQVEQLIWADLQHLQLPNCVSTDSVS